MGPKAFLWPLLGLNRHNVILASLFLVSTAIGSIQPFLGLNSHSLVLASILLIYAWFERREWKRVKKNKNKGERKMWARDRFFFSLLLCYPNNGKNLISLLFCLLSLKPNIMLVLMAITPSQPQFFWHHCPWLVFSFFSILMALMISLLCLKLSISDKPIKLLSALTSPTLLINLYTSP